MNYAKKPNLISLDVLISNFLHTFRSEHTRLSYRTDLKQFFTFCKNHTNINELNINQISETACFAWLHTIHELPNSTVRRKIAAVNSFFQFCEQNDFSKTNPVQFLKRPKVSHIGKTNILSIDEITKILNFIQIQQKYSEIKHNTFQKHLWHKRFTILYTLFTVGMRVDELCKLKCQDLEHLNDDLYRLHLTTKGNKKHSPLIHPDTAQILLDYINICSKNKEDLIFENIHRSNIYYLLKLCAKRVGITKKIGPHSLRASLATHLHKSGVPIAQIKDLLNHKNISTTLLYTQVSDQELLENSGLLNFDKMSK